MAEPPFGRMGGSPFGSMAESPFAAMGQQPFGAWASDLGGLWRGWLESFEGEATTGVERLVGGDAFAELLVQLAENAAGLSSISADFWDLVLRNLRLAGRADIDRLARQLATTEDKLERLLQAVESPAEESVGW
jgi:hypothetical protein